MKTDVRLRRADITDASAPEKRLHGIFFSLSVTRLRGDRGPVFTCAVSKHVAASAVRRNLLKRRCREAVRGCMRTFSSKKSLALVFRAKQRASGATPADISLDIQSLFEKI